MSLLIKYSCFTSSIKTTNFSYVIFVLGILFAVVGCGSGAEKSAVQLENYPAIEDAPAYFDESKVKQAYQLIPHRRTEFHFGESKLSGVEEKYLQLMFRSIEQAIVIRVGLYRELSRNNYHYRDKLNKYGEIISFVGKLTPPETLDKYHDHILSAMKLQRNFLANWMEKEEDFNYRSREKLVNNPKVDKAHQKLLAAYEILKDRFKDRNNSHQAFFDYHCALDFK